MLWCQHHNGIWRSEDNARSWQEVRGAPVSSFGFALAVHPHEPGTAWFVPAQADERRVPVDGALVVNRTRDGGHSFETLRHGLALAPDGRTLLMGSTTGGLWGSGDGGDHWQAVSLRVAASAADLRAAHRLSDGAAATGCDKLVVRNARQGHVVAHDTQSGDDSGLHKLKNWCHVLLPSCLRAMLGRRRHRRETGPCRRPSTSVPDRCSSR